MADPKGYKKNNSDDDHSSYTIVVFNIISTMCEGLGYFIYSS